MSMELFDPASYMVIYKPTGEEVDVSILIKDARDTGWERAYAKTLADYMECAGVQSSSLLAWIIRSRDGKNLILGTQTEIGKKAKVSRGTVISIFKTLIEKKMLIKVRSGCYMVTPKMMRNGDKHRGAMLLRMWDTTTEEGAKK